MTKGDTRVLLALCWSCVSCSMMMDEICNHTCSLAMWSGLPITPAKLLHSVQYSHGKVLNLEISMNFSAECMLNDRQSLGI